MDDETPDFYVIGKVEEDGVFYMASSQQYPTNAIAFNENGSVRRMDGPTDEGALPYFQTLFETAGIEITGVSFYDSGYDQQHSANMSEYPTINP